METAPNSSPSTSNTGHSNAGLSLNPSLRLMATFKVFDEQTRSVNHHDFLLDRYPEFQQVLLALASKLKAAEAFADIDSNLALELAEKGIVQLGALDKSLIVALNPQALATITLYTRFADKPSNRSAIVVNEYPAASSWLINAQLNNYENADVSALNESDTAILLQHGALVEQHPPARVEYPAPLNDQTSWQAAIATADRIYIQAAGETIPANVLRLLGRQVPELPNNKTIVWSCDSGTRLPHATLVPDKEIKQLELDEAKRAEIPSVKKNRQLWQQKLALAKIAFKRNAYTQIDDITSDEHKIRLRKHVQNLVTHQYFGPVGDGQVERRMALHNETVTASLHHRLAKLVSIIVGEEVHASYAYLGCYLAGSVLERHIDRPQCQYNLSIVFDMADEQGNDVEPWPIFLQLKKKAIAINLGIGCGLLYRGTDIEHWREALPEGQRAIVCFFHFVKTDFVGSLL